MTSTPEQSVMGICEFHLHGSLFTENESIGVSFWPAEHTTFEIWIRKRQGGKDTKYIESKSFSQLNFTRKSGDYVLKFRWRATTSTTWSPWSTPKKFSILKESKGNIKRVIAHRIFEHQISSMTTRLSNGVITLHNPWALPPNCPKEGAKWFPTAIYEGATSLINCTKEYYLDPLNYLISSIATLKNKGAKFITWKDIINNNYKAKNLNCILQFDIDAGPKSFLAISNLLQEMDVVGSIMIHYSCKNWYEWTLDELNIQQLKQLESSGWEIGYHNNSLSNLQSLDHIADYSEEILTKAAEQFKNDIYQLRKHFDIDIYTHHGGNVLNRYVTPNDDLKLTCVDRKFSKHLWKDIGGKFSDGGFLARPAPLHKHIETLKSGINFFRLHPVKYGNYNDCSDLQPLPPHKDLGMNANVLTPQQTHELKKQSLWFTQRHIGRQATPLSHNMPNKPISSRFTISAQVNDKIHEFRSKRRESFLKIYPWTYGDPRVFWWQMLTSFAPSGKILNVGALPPTQKSETIAFLPHDADLIEIDIDASRQPDIVGDFSDTGVVPQQSFDAVLLFGLPYFERPLDAIINCFSCIKPTGRVLLGFCSDTHPERGGFWRPEERPVWRPDKLIAPPLNLKTKLWSFDEESIRILLSHCKGAFHIEAHNHYWFIVGEAEA